jgi:hypothetical protein
MSTRFLSKVVAGAALGCASLLMASPALAAADDGKHHHKDDHGGWIYTVPEPTKSGHKAYIIQICKKEQEKPYVWSEVTGKQKLEPQPWHSKKWKKHLKENNVEEWVHDDKKHDKKHKFEDHKKWDKKNDHKKHDVLEELEKVEEFDKKHEVEDKKFDHKKHEDHKKHDKKHDKKIDVLEELEKVEDFDHKKDGKEHEKKIDVLEELEAVEKKDHPFAYFAKVWIPKDVEPGAYKLKGSCAKGELLVAPHGWVDGGDGGLGSGTNAGMLTGGAGMVAAATLGGLALMRRRATNGTVA